MDLSVPGGSNDAGPPALLQVLLGAVSMAQVRLLSFAINA
jgi:hypothetical protein